MDRLDIFKRIMNEARKEGLNEFRVILQEKWDEELQFTSEFVSKKLDMYDRIISEDNNIDRFEMGNDVTYKDYINKSLKLANQGYTTEAVMRLRRAITSAFDYTYITIGGILKERLDIIESFNDYYQLIIDSKDKEIETIVTNYENEIDKLELQLKNQGNNVQDMVVIEPPEEVNEETKPDEETEQDEPEDEPEEKPPIKKTRKINKNNPFI